MQSGRESVNDLGKGSQYSHHRIFDEPGIDEPRKIEEAAVPTKKNGRFPVWKRPLAGTV